MMTRFIKQPLIGLGLGLLTITACSSNDTAHVPLSYFEGNALERHDLKAQSQMEYLEVQLNPSDSQLRLAELRKIRAFLRGYEETGHGELIMSIPSGGDTSMLAVQAAAEARDLAWQSGVDYQDIVGLAYPSADRPGAPMIMAYKRYVALEPDCPSLSTIDFSNAVSNSDLPTLGCAVRTNMAAIIADPGDLLGERALGEADLDRRANQLEDYREGNETGAARADDASGAISGAIN